MNDAFISIVESDKSKDMFVVRARIKGDLENVFGNQHDVEVDAGTDYKFRMALDKTYVKDVISNRIDNIDYGNFKDSISKKDYDRKERYGGVWSVLYKWQVRLYGESNRWYTSYRNN